jgi:hypothetical protein
VQESARLTIHEINKLVGVTEGVPRNDAPTTRHAPPASEGIDAGAGKAVSATSRRQARHPAKPGPLSLKTTETLFDEVVEGLEEGRPTHEIARRAGVSADGKTVRKVIETAREAFARRAEDYVELHFRAAQEAAQNGDAGPAQWAIERIVEGGVRVVDNMKAAPTMPSLQIGIAVGGVPQPKQAVQVFEVPTAVDALPPGVDTP